MEDSIRPCIDKELAKSILESLYHKTAANITELRSYLARNFLVRFEGDCKEQKSCVLKITDFEEVEESLSVQFDIMQHLQEDGFICSHPIPNIKGNFMEGMCFPDSSGNDQKCAVYMLSYIEGKVANKLVSSPELLFNVGSLLANVRKSMKKVPSHVKVEPAKGLWSPMNVSLLSDYLHYLSTDQQKLIQNVIRMFMEKETDMMGLEKGIIHGDLHDENIIVVDHDTNAYEELGIIDFEHVSYSYCVYDLVISMSVFMMAVSVQDGKFLEVSGIVLAGYLSKYKLTKSERELLYTFILGRYAQELVLCTVEDNKQNGRNDYLSEIFENAWPQLHYLVNCGSEKVNSTWENILKDWEPKK